MHRQFVESTGENRIDQVVEQTSSPEDAATRLAQLREEITSCVAAEDSTEVDDVQGSTFALDQVWSVSGLGEEAWLIRYWRLHPF